MDARSHEFYQKRVHNAQNIQQELNQNYNQAQAQAQQQAMMGMQFGPQMGRGMGPPGFQQMQRPAQMPNMQAQQQQQQQRQQQQQQQFRPQQQQPQQFQQQQFPQQFQQQQQLPMGMANNMGNQSGPAMGQNPSMMGMQQNRQFLMQDIAKLAPPDKKKVHELAAKMMTEASPEKKQQAFNIISQRIAPEQIQRLQQQGQNPMHLYFQQQAFQVLRANAQSAQTRQSGQGQQGQQGQPGQQGGQQNLNAGQAPMMQQQASRQSFQQRPNMATPQTANDFGQQFSNNNNMDSIIDQQMKGYMAQESGQPVVPANSSRPPSSQPMAASMSNQNQNQNQTPRPPQQQPTQQQQQLAMQMRMNQANQQNQAQLHPQSQMQQSGAGPSQSPGMGTLNTPVARPVNSMDQMNAQGMQGFGGQPFKQAMQSNPGLMTAFMNAIPPEQRQQVHNMSQDQLRMVINKWQSAKSQQNQMQNRPPSQLGQANGNMPNANMNGQPVQGMQPQMGQPNGFNQQRVQPPTPPTQAQAMMDSMDLPPNLVQQDTFKNMPQEVRKWKDLRAWLSQNPNAIPQGVRASLGNLQHRQFQAIMQKRMQDKVSQGQNPNMSVGQNMGVQGHPQPTPQPQSQPPQQQQQQQLQQFRQQNMQRPMPNNMPPQMLQVSPADIASVRQTQNIPAGATDDQLRAYIQQTRMNKWNATSEAQRAHMIAQYQAQAQAQGQQVGANGAAPPPNQPQQPTPTQTLATPQQATMPTPNSAQTAKQPMPAKAQTQANKNKKATQPAQGGKNLKRPSADISADGPNSTPQRKGSQQQGGKMVNATTTSAEDNASVQSKRPDQKQVPQQGSKADGSENLNRLRTIGQEEQIRFAQESMPDIQMTPQEYQTTVDRLRRLVVDMGKIGRGLSKWYGISRDDERARGFFRMVCTLPRQIRILLTKDSVYELFDSSLMVKKWSNLNPPLVSTPSNLTSLATCLKGWRARLPSTSTQKQPSRHRVSKWMLKTACRLPVPKSLPISSSA